MTAKELFDLIKEKAPELPSEIQSVAYKHNGKKGWNTSDDLNAYLREELIDLLILDYNIKERLAILFLLKAEIEYCRKESMMHEPLRMITYMAWSLGVMEDIPFLVEAKFNTSFDARIGLDIPLIFGKNIEKTKQYFQENPNENYDIVTLIDQYEDPQNMNPIQFEEAMKSYYNLN